jgi:hypothetical protein
VPTDYQLGSNFTKIHTGVLSQVFSFAVKFFYGSFQTSYRQKLLSDPWNFRYQPNGCALLIGKNFGLTGGGNGTSIPQAFRYFIIKAFGQEYIRNELSNEGAGNLDPSGLSDDLKATAKPKNHNNDKNQTKPIDKAINVLKFMAK